MIKLNIDKLIDDYGIKCNYYPILAARLFDMRLADYLTFLRDKCGATIIGSKGWPVAYFADVRNCNQVVAELNKRWNKCKERMKENV
jgi:hypothetical protein